MRDDSVNRHENRRLIPAFLFLQNVALIKKGLRRNKFITVMKAVVSLSIRDGCTLRWGQIGILE
jgi:hypothetical protein